MRSCITARLVCVVTSGREGKGMECCLLGVAFLWSAGSDKGNAIGAWIFQYDTP